VCGDSARHLTLPAKSLLVASTTGGRYNITIIIQYFIDGFKRYAIFNLVQLERNDNRFIIRGTDHERFINKPSSYCIIMIYNNIGGDK